MSRMTEETLVKNIVRHKGVISGMLHAMVGDWAAAEDLFQEVAVVMTRKRDSAGEDCHFVAWARQIALNVVRDYRKKKARSRVRVLDDAALEAVSSAFEEPEESVWDLRREALHECAEELPDRDRSLLRRRYDGEEEIESLARSMSMTRGAVDTLLYRLRRGLHQCVEGRLKRLETP